MVVKAKRGRRRYIAFRVTSVSPPSPDELLAALRAACAYPDQKPPKLIQFDGHTGIVRCLEPERAATMVLLSRVSLQDRRSVVQTISTSGTLRALRERLPRSSGDDKGSVEE
jgi:RNase P/RNase MRP subunit POP5